MTGRVGRPALAVLFGALCVPSIGAAQEMVGAGPSFVAVTEDRANLRLAPDPEAGRVDRMQAGTVLRNLGCESVATGPEPEHWCQVETPDGAIGGWISAELLTTAADPEAGHGRGPATWTRSISPSPGGAAVPVRERLDPGHSADVVVEAVTGQYLTLRLVGASGPLAFEFWDPAGETLYRGPEDGLSFEAEILIDGPHVLRILAQGTRETAFEVDFTIDG